MSFDWAAAAAALRQRVADVSATASSSTDELAAGATAEASANTSTNASANADDSARPSALRCAGQAGSGKRVMWVPTPPAYPPPAHLSKKQRKAERFLEGQRKAEETAADELWREVQEAEAAAKAAAEELWREVQEAEAAAKAERRKAAIGGGC